MTNIITISNLTKKFGRRVVISDINLQIGRSNSIAFIGRNGSGKSTLLKIIAGLMPFEAGSVVHNGKLKFGYVPERFPAINITARDYIIQIGMVSGLQKDEIHERSTQLFKDLFMQDMIETPICYLSKGTIQKMAVVQAFITTPDVLLLDEPISGQDMASQQVFIDMINHLRQHGVTVLCSCHEDYMVNAIAEHVYEIADGKLCAVEQTQKQNIGDIYKLLFVRNGQEIEIHATACESNGVIRKMLLDNFELRGLNNEKII